MRQVVEPADQRRGSRAPVRFSSTAAYCPARPIERRTASGSLQHVDAGDPARAGVGQQQRGEDADGGRLAGAVRARAGRAPCPAAPPGTRRRARARPPERLHQAVGDHRRSTHRGDATDRPLPRGRAARPARVLVDWSDGGTGAGPRRVPADRSGRTGPGRSGGVAAGHAGLVAARAGRARAGRPRGPRRQSPPDPAQAWGASFEVGQAPRAASASARDRPATSPRTRLVTAAAATKPP